MKIDLFRYKVTTPIVHHGGSGGTLTRSYTREWTTGGDLLFGCGLLFQSGGLWIGAHYSSACRRWCINLLPCLTLWVALPGGQTP